MGIWQHILHITISLFILNDVCSSQYLRNGYYENHAPLNELLTEIIELNTRLTDPYWQKSSAMETMYKEAEDDDEWVVEIDGGLEEAQWVASLTGCKLLGKMKGFDHMYVMRHSKEASPGTVRSLLKRSKRDTNEKVPKETKSLSELVKELKQVKFVEHQQYLARRKRFAINKQFSNLNKESTFNDPYFAEQWQLHESVILNYPYDISPLRVDHHISDVWQMGYTGKGVVVTIIDDGIDYTHDDLRPNYDPLASYDLNDDDDDPMPTLDEINSHGTRCAGEVAMAANNSRCGVGVAYNAKIGGIRKQFSNKYLN
ncbi:subtilase family domain-containing protein [Ditylenchus destructor]|nr:subtilase family domain-containing protein [Ditylenchus destructor]